MSSTFGVGYPHSGWNGTVAGKPVVYVTPLGPDDGGDFGVDTSGTTTSGIQEAVNAVQTAGGGVVYLSTGVGTTANVTISKPSVSLINPTIQAGATFMNPSIGSLTIDDTSNAVTNILLKGLSIGKSTNTTQAALTFNQPGSNGMGGIKVADSFISGSIVCTNPTAGGQGEPTEVYFDNDFIGGSVQTAPLNHFDMVGQFFYKHCCFVAYKNNMVAFQLDGNNSGIQQDTTSIICTGCQYVPVAGLTGTTFAYIANGAACGKFDVDQLYIEDNSPVLLLKINTNATSTGRIRSHFSRVDGYTSGGLTLVDMVAWPLASTNAILEFDHVSSNYANPILGTVLSGYGSFLRVSHCKGLTDFFNSTSTPVYASGSTFANNYGWPVDIVLTVAGTTQYVITDNNSATLTVTISNTYKGFLYRLQPGWTITPTGAGATWVWSPSDG